MHHQAHTAYKAHTHTLTQKSMYTTYLFCLDARAAPPLLACKHARFRLEAAQLVTQQLQLLKEVGEEGKQ